MTYKEALEHLERLRSLIAGGGDDSVYNGDDRSLIESLYRNEMGRSLRECSCKHRYPDGVMELYHQLRINKKMQEDKQYLLKAGLLVWIGSDCYNRHTLTDELAIEYLNAHPDATIQFDRVPKAIDD